MKKKGADVTSNPCPEPRTEAGIDRETLSFPILGNVRFRVVKDGNGTLVQFGRISFQSWLVFGVVALMSITAAPFQIHFGAPAWISILVPIVVLCAFAFALVWQTRYVGVELRCESHHRCNLRAPDFELLIEPMHRVLVMNSHRFRDGGVATEGISELFLCRTTDHCVLYYPIASSPNYGDYDGLARIIAEAVGATLEIIKVRDDYHPYLK